MGRRPKERSAQIAEAQRRAHQGETPAQIAKAMGMRKPTLLQMMARAGFCYYQPTGFWVPKEESGESVSH